MNSASSSSLVVGLRASSHSLVMGELFLSCCNASSFPSLSFPAAASDIILDPKATQIPNTWKAEVDRQTKYLGGRKSVFYCKCTKI